MTRLWPGEAPLDRSAFEKIVEKSLNHLPRKFKSRLRNIVIEIEDRPSQALLDELGITHGSLYGLYQGVPLTEREWNFGNALPDRISIYQEPIERVASTEEEMEKIVLETVMHEIGHYFGFDDNELYAIEDQKKRSGKSKQ